MVPSELLKELAAEVYTPTSKRNVARIAELTQRIGAFVTDYDERRYVTQDHRRLGFWYVVTISRRRGLSVTVDQAQPLEDFDHDALFAASSAVDAPPSPVAVAEAVVVSVYDGGD
jgi:hypothetical protein